MPESEPVGRSEASPGERIKELEAELNHLRALCESWGKSYDALQAELAEVKRQRDLWVDRYNALLRGGIPDA